MIRVALVDDQALVRSGLRIIVNTADDMEVVAEGANGLEALDIARSARPDVICMDIEMPVKDGLSAAREIVDECADSGPEIIMLTTFGDDHYVVDAVSAGISGFLLKTCRPEELLDAIRRVAEGKAILDDDVTRIVMNAMRQRSEGARGEGGTRGSEMDAGHALDPRQALEAANVTDREREVLELLAAGHTNAEISEALFVSESTVKTHVSSLLRKVHARDRIQLVVWAHAHGIRPRS
ncbi:MAG: response regulator transcription factor [Actinomyces sp.]|nr:response regulator transcription factor [Actinomyces sp.]